MQQAPIRRLNELNQKIKRRSFEPTDQNCKKAKSNQKLIINHFGPLEHVELELRDFMVFIGPQTSGKSTLMKSVLFFKTLKDDLTRFVFDSLDSQPDINSSHRDYPATQLKKAIRGKFVGYWGTTKHLDPFNLSFSFGNGKDVFLSLDEKGYVKVNFSNAFHSTLDEILRQAEKFKIKHGRPTQKYLSADDIIALESQKRAFLVNIGAVSEQLFSDVRTPIFIPAGRSLLSTLSDQLQKHLLSPSRSTFDELEEIDPYLLDFPLKGFIDRITRTKNLFTQQLSTLIEDKKKLTSVPIDFNTVYFFRDMIGKILRGSYVFEKDSEKLYFPNSERYVRLSFASSGQQESIWILLQTFLIALNGTRVNLMIEEPEAHLYPEAQKQIIDLIVAVSNLSCNQILLTTHSPYVLSALNNLLYAFQIGQKKQATVEKIVDQRLWLAVDKFAAYHVENGKIENILDDKLKLIKVESIDSASRIINDEYEKLAAEDD